MRGVGESARLMSLLLIFFGADLKLPAAGFLALLFPAFAHSLTTIFYRMRVMV